MSLWHGELVTNSHHKHHIPSPLGAPFSNMVLIESQHGKVVTCLTICGVNPWLCFICLIKHSVTMDRVIKEPKLPNLSNFTYNYSVTFKRDRLFLMLCKQTPLWLRNTPNVQNTDYKVLWCIVDFQNNECVRLKHIMVQIYLALHFYGIEIM